MQEKKVNLVNFTLINVLEAKDDRVSEAHLAVAPAINQRSAAMAAFAPDPAAMTAC